MKCLNLYFKKLRKAIKTVYLCKERTKSKVDQLFRLLVRLLKKVQHSAHHLFTELFKGSSLKFYTNAYSSAIK